METLKIDSLLDEKGLDSGKLQQLANTIMQEYCIVNGPYRYYPIEIEFYIYDKEKHPDRHVYPRDNKSAGELFFHYSGMDICFESSLDNGRFGGLLIRALERFQNNKKDAEFGGPLVCVNEILNNAEDKCEIKHISRPESEKVHAVQFGRRVGIKGEDKYSKAQYRFIKEGLKEIKMARLTYNFDEPGPNKYSPTYKFKKLED